MALARKPIVKKPSNPNPRPKRPGPFRGPTPEGIIQTLDVGGGPFGERFIAKSMRNKDTRQYVSVDPEYKKLQERQNYKLIPIRGLEYLQELVEKGIKVRHLNFDMPNMDLFDYNFKLFFELLPKVLLPNGKLFVTTDDPESTFLRVCNNKGYGVRERAKYRKAHLDLLKSKDKPETLNGLPVTYWMYQCLNKNHPVYVFEITYPLKMAYKGNKEQRRNWPRV